MTASAAGFYFARKGGYNTFALSMAFISAPILSLLHKRELDFFYIGNASG